MGGAWAGGAAGWEEPRVGGKHCPRGQDLDPRARPGVRAVGLGRRAGRRVLGQVRASADGAAMTARARRRESSVS